MKRVIIGGFLSLIGAIGCLSVFLTVSGNLVSSWPTAVGRFLTSVDALGMMPLFMAACILLFLGIIILAVEYFKKDN
ncbi:MAG: hypothetical protein GX942_07160 [Papillibacter sp.]|nr:hypothetical protein [Papillibacter sp.]